MEQKIQGLVESHFANFKTDLYAKMNTTISPTAADELKNYIDNYVSLSLKKEDFYVKKEQPIVEEEDRCIAKRCDSTQCTRRKKKGCDLCGTHVKNAPNGIIETTDGNIKRVEIWVIDIRGIQYYVDADNNVYNTEDVLEARHNPRVIGTLSVDGKNVTIL
jgi:hypothetical protein